MSLVFLSQFNGSDITCLTNKNHLDNRMTNLSNRKHHPDCVSPNCPSVVEGRTIINFKDFLNTKRRPRISSRSEKDIRLIIVA